MFSGFCLVREFTVGELRLLIDSLRFSKHILYNHSKVSFRYVTYSADKWLCVKRRPDSSVREHIISPYQNGSQEGKVVPQSATTTSMTTSPTAV